MTLPRLLATALSIGLVLAGSRSITGAVADVRIQTVMSGASGDSRVQFIEMVLQSEVAHCWGPQVATTTAGADSDDGDCWRGANETRSRTMLVFFDAVGREIGRFKFPENPPNSLRRNVSSRRRPGGEPTGTAIFRTQRHQSVLVATEGFAALPGAAVPDFVMPPLLSAIAGKVCFYGNTGENPNAPVLDLCVSYGPFSGDTQGAGAPAAALQIVDAVALTRAGDDFDNSNRRYAVTASPVAHNAAGRAFALPRASRVAQGQILFEHETFGGNGRTCADCHKMRDSGRLTPVDVQARFAAVGNTYDALFLAESAATGFDFNLNTLTIASPPTASSGTDFHNASGGDLTGIISGSAGGRGKVLARTGPTTYLVYGGVSPRLSGTVIDGSGNRADVLSVTPGTLDGIDSPSRMRTSRVGQGRALILEHIDGFENPPVFRKSPHILNLLQTAPFGFNNEERDLKVFTRAAVKQHFPRTLARAFDGPNPDFREPTPDELSALEEFQLAQEFPSGNDAGKFDLERFLTTPQQRRGRDVFFGPVAKCSQCHGGIALATTTVNIQGKGVGVNARFDTGVANDVRNGPAGDGLPCEPGVGGCNTREFSVPSLFNITNLAPYFHDGKSPTIRDAVLHYLSLPFLLSPAGRAVGGVAFSGTQLDDILAFLEALSQPASSPPPAAIPMLTQQQPQTPPGRLAPPAPVAGTASASRVGTGVRTVAVGFVDPTDIAWAASGEIFVAERSGVIRLVRDGALLAAPVATIPDVAPDQGDALVALAVHPAFPKAPFLYALTALASGYRLERFEIEAGTARHVVVLADRLAPHRTQPVGTLRVGPDRRLYLALDDGDRERAAGDPGTYSGKILRVDIEGPGAVAGRPGLSLYAGGFHTPRGLVWDRAGTLWVAETGRLSSLVEETRPVPRVVWGLTRALNRDLPIAGAVATTVPGDRGPLESVIVAGASYGLVRVTRRGAGGGVQFASDRPLQGRIDSARALTVGSDGTLYVATANALISVDPQELLP